MINFSFTNKIMRLRHVTASIILSIYAQNDQPLDENWTTGRQLFPNKRNQSLRCLSMIISSCMCA